MLPSLRAHVDPCHNGMRSLDHTGRPAAHAHYFKSTEIIGAELDREASLEGMTAAQIANRPGSLTRWVLTHSEKPVELKVPSIEAQAYYTRLFQDGVLVAADEATARRVGTLKVETTGSGKNLKRTVRFVDPAEVLASSRARAVAEWKKHYGEDAWPCALADDPRAGYAKPAAADTTSTPADAPAGE